jgi:hypothetical protein
MIYNDAERRSLFNNMLNVIMPSVVMLNVVAPIRRSSYFIYERFLLNYFQQFFFFAFVSQTQE